MKTVAFGKFQIHQDSLLTKTGISPKSTKPCAFRNRRPSKLTDPTVLRILESIKHKFRFSLLTTKSTVFRIGTYQTPIKHNLNCLEFVLSSKCRFYETVSMVLHLNIDTLPEQTNLFLRPLSRAEKVNKVM